MDVVHQARVRNEEVELVFEVFEARRESDVSRDTLMAALGWRNTAKNRLHLTTRIKDARLLADQRGYALSEYDHASKSWKLTKTDTGRIVAGIDRRLRTGTTFLDGAVLHAKWAAQVTQDPWEIKYLAMALEVAESLTEKMGTVMDLWHLRDEPGNL
jgi:hypothetical protein